MMVNFRKNINGLFVIILIVFQTLLMIYFSMEKQGYHVDEMYSYELSNSTSGINIGSIQYDKKTGSEWISGDEIKNYLVVNDGESFSYDSVISNQKADVHPPIYYLIIHTICSFFPNVFSKWFGLSINIIFFILIDITLYSFAKKLSDSDSVAILSVAIYRFSVGAINTITFIRMYALLTLLVVLFIYFHLSFRNLTFEEKYEKSSKVPIKVWISLCIITISGTLTQYYFLAFAFFFCVFWCCNLLYKKQLKILFQYVAIEFFSICISIAIFPAMLKHIFFGYRGKESFEAIAENDSWREYIMQYISIIDNSIGWGFLKALTVIFVVGFLLFMFQKLYMKISVKCKKSHLEIIGVKIINVKYDILITYYMTFSFILLFSVICYLILIARISPYREDRYIMILFPIIAFLGASIIFKLMNIIGKKKEMIILLFVLVISIFSWKDEYLKYLYIGSDERKQIVMDHSDLSAIFFYEDGNINTILSELMHLPYVFFLKSDTDLTPLQESLSERDFSQGLLVYTQSIDKNAVIEKLDLLFTQNFSIEELINMRGKVFLVTF